MIILMEYKPNKKIQVAADLYRTEKVSLSKASEIAGMDIESFKEMLEYRNIEIKTAVPSAEEIENEMNYIILNNILDVIKKIEETDKRIMT